MAKVEAVARARDGRAERSERTRDAVVNAMLDLIEDGDLRPTAPRIAERAGVALRTVFHHFADLEALFAVAAQRQMQRHLARTPIVTRDAPFERRLTAFVASRSEALEAISPVRRSALLSEPFSRVIAKHLGWIRARGRREVERVFERELKALTPARRRDALEAVTAFTSWSTWEALRAHQGLSQAQARRVMKHAIVTLLEQE
jgi:AcrR family transcriptional regulator